MDTYFSTIVTGPNITIHLEKIVLTETTVAKSTIGDINTEAITQLFNVLFLPSNMVISMLNEILVTTPLALVDVIGNIFTFDDLAVTNKNDYMYLGVSPQWLPFRVKPRPGPNGKHKPDDPDDPPATPDMINLAIESDIEVESNLKHRKFMPGPMGMMHFI